MLVISALSLFFGLFNSARTWHASDAIADEIAAPLLKLDESGAIDWSKADVLAPADGSGKRPQTIEQVRYRLFEAVTEPAVRRVEDGWRGAASFGFLIAAMSFVCGVLTTITSRRQH